MITNKNDMLRALQDWNQCLRLCCLGSLIDEDLAEFDVSDSSVKGSHASCANNISVTQNFVLGLSLQILELLFIFLIELSLFLSANH